MPLSRGRTTPLLGRCRWDPESHGDQKNLGVCGKQFSFRAVEGGALSASFSRPCLLAARRCPTRDRFVKWRIARRWTPPGFSDSLGFAPARSASLGKGARLAPRQVGFMGVGLDTGNRQLGAASIGPRRPRSGGPAILEKGPTRPRVIEPRAFVAPDRCHGNLLWEPGYGQTDWAPIVQKQSGRARPD